MKTILGIILFSSLSLAQPNSVAQSIATASVAASGSVAITGSNSIGQSSHQVLIYTSDVTPGSCTGFTGPVSMTGSIDNVIFKQITTSATQPIALLSNNVAYVAFGVGVYPYLKVNWTNNATANCALTIWYTGSTSPNAYTGSPRVVNDEFSFAPIVVSSSGDTDIATSCPGIGLAGSGVLVLYELYLYNPAATNTVLVKLGSTISGSNAYRTMLTLTSFATGAQFAGMPNTGKPHYVAYQTTTNFQNIRLNLANATEIDGYAVYRCE